MQNNYSATMPANIDQRDVVLAALNSLPTKPDGFWFNAGKLFIGYETTVLSAAQQTAFQNAVTGATTDPNATWRNSDALQAKIAGALAQLRVLKTQATALQSPSNAGPAGAGTTADYTTANLASLNDALHKIQRVGEGLFVVADDLIGLARIISGQLDGVN